ncbi:MAG: AAA family ATPase [Devosiaceae bacterium]|nr:AAA family ATPase [Devosiaceae bacterium]
MKFQRLKLHGFKSFCDPVDLHLEPGLTGVVGPNGCGKSNLMEAMRWVMGESSYKAMRASGMDDVIFSGSKNRPGRNSAEVTLVLDNSDRTAPAGLNDSDILEVTRRIERENGSVYKVNGRDVRARDVQLLFADASTGAHSPALVRQGQIGELIAAKPVKRRALLEEAAGISGLYSRRHEAELRLRGAENNLERVDDIIAQVEGQLDTLKRQARLAVRYRNISGHIRKAEAALYHVRWVTARIAQKEAEAKQGQMISALADAKHNEHKANVALEKSDQAQQPLREEEAKKGAIVQRLKILREQLELEIKKAGNLQTDLENRQKQIASDMDREKNLVEESEQLLAGYEGEKNDLLKQTEGQFEAAQTAKEEADKQQLVLQEAQNNARQTTQSLAQLRAHRSQAERSMQDAKTRMEKLEAQIGDVGSEAKKIRDELDGDKVIMHCQDELALAKDLSTKAEAGTIEAEKLSRQAQSDLTQSEPGLRELEGQLHRLESEAETLARVLNIEDNGLWPAIVDELKVNPGYEIALGVTLGDDLEAPCDNGAPIYWKEPTGGKDDPKLPDEAIPLSNFVSGTEILQRSLDQVGIVSAENGEKLMDQLHPGQRLVTMEGDLWRWDGLVIKADAPSPAAQRLSQRNRLADLDVEISQERKKLNLLMDGIGEQKTQLSACQNEVKMQREAWRNAQRQLSRAQEKLDGAKKSVGDLVSRQSALEEARVRLAFSLKETEEIYLDAKNDLSGADSEDDAQQRAKAADEELAAANMKSQATKLALGNFENSAQMREARIKQLQTEMQSWLRRQKGAQEQLEILGNRHEQISEQLTTLAKTPDDNANKRNELDDQLEEATRQHNYASDNLNKAQTIHREADRASREATKAFSEVSTELARIDERLKGLMGQRQQIEQIVQEALGIRADQTADAAAIKAQDPLPDANQTEKKVERLKSERERLGGVNLSAEKEMQEVSEKLTTMVNDRDDLITAISKLRTGISSLNKEGRTRLNEAFDKVNAHFRELFTSLFNGGNAELTFIESDDPLEAGLEILACPPGKRTQTLSLLSGGEQALTALALIFAVFLTNPAPICVLDEVDAPLDDANVERFCNLLDSMCSRTQTRFLVITHNPITMARVDRLFGVTMAERGVSQLVSVDLATAQAVQEVG